MRTAYEAHRAAATRPDKGRHAEADQRAVNERLCVPPVTAQRTIDRPVCLCLADLEVNVRTCRDPRSDIADQLADDRRTSADGGQQHHGPAPRSALPKLAVFRSRRRLRRRWPGSRAGLCLGEARPAQAGPHSSRVTQIKTAHTSRSPVQRTAVLLGSPLSSARPPRQGRPSGPSHAMASPPLPRRPLTRIRRLRAQRTDPATLDGRLGRCPARTIQWKAFTMPETWKACPPSAVAPRDTGMLFRSADPASSPPLAGSQQSLRAFAQ